MAWLRYIDIWGGMVVQAFTGDSMNHILQALPTNEQAIFAVTSTTVPGGPRFSLVFPQSSSTIIETFEMPGIVAPDADFSRSIDDSRSEVCA